MWKEESGFTLIEVLISILIISIAIIPISYTFTNVTKDTVKTEKMLGVNKLGAMYMENIKARSIDEYRELFTLGSEREGEIVLSSDDDLAALLLPEIPDEYMVRLSYDEDDLYSRPLDAGNNEILPEVEDELDVDFTIDIDNKKSGILVYDSDGVEQDSSIYPATFTKRTIEISALKDTSEYNLKVIDDGIVLSNITFDIDQKIIAFDIGDKVPNTNENTDVEIYSQLLDEIKVYVFEDGNDDLKYNFSINSGKISISRNLKRVSDVNVHLVSAKVEVLDKSSGDLILELKGSVTNE